jgi:hypothetical protein
MQALLNLSKVDQGLSVFIAGGDGTYRFRELPGLSQLTIDTVSDSLYARAVRRLQVGVRNQFRSLFAPFRPKAPQILHEKHPSTFAILFWRPLLEHVTKNCDAGAHSNVDLSFALVPTRS